MSDSVIRRRRVAAVLAGAMVPLVLLAGLLLPISFEKTEAGWTDETAMSAAASTFEVPAPTLTRECEFRPGLLGISAHVRIFWELPEGYELEDVVVDASTSGLGSVLAPLTGFNVEGNTVELNDGTYRTNVRTNLLGGLLGLGSELEIAMRVSVDPEKHPEAWTSDTASVASNAGLIGGLGGNCRNLT